MSMLTRFLHSPALDQAIHLLNQMDASVEVIKERAGQNIIAAAGELHLERSSFCACS